MSTTEERDWTTTELKNMKKSDLRKLIQSMWVKTGLGTAAEGNERLNDVSTYENLRRENLRELKDVNHSSISDHSNYRYKYISYFQYHI